MMLFIEVRFSSYQEGLNPGKMTMVILVCFLMLPFIPTGIVAGAVPDLEKQFMVVFGPSGLDNPIPREIHIINNDDNTGTVKVFKIGDFKAKIQIRPPMQLNPGEGKLVKLQNRNNINKFMLMSQKFLLDYIKERTFVVESDIKISVFAVNKDNASTDSFLVLPAAGLGKHYVVPSWRRKFFGLGFGSSFIVVAPAIYRDPAAESFQVNFTFPWRSDDAVAINFATIPGYTNPLSVQIDGFDMSTFKSYGSTFQILCDKDLTGTIITSEEPIVVVSGNERTSIFGNEKIMINGTEWDKDSTELLTINGTSWKTSYDHIEEMIPPVSTWGKHFVTAPLAERKAGDVFRLIASEDDSELKVMRYRDSTCRCGTNILSLLSTETHTVSQEGGFLQLDVGSDEYMVIRSRKPILVVQYSKSSIADFTDNDPLMMIIPPVEQYRGRYSFTTFKGVIQEEYNNFITVAVQSHQASGLVLDGSLFNSVYGHRWKELGDSGFSATTLRIKPGHHTMRHSDPTATFMVLSYGFVEYEAYGHPAGMRHSPLYSYCQPTTSVAGDGIDNDCDGRIDEEHDNGIDDDGDGRVDEDLAYTFMQAKPSGPILGK